MTQRESPASVSHSSWEIEWNQNNSDAIWRRSGACRGCRFKLENLKYYYMDFLKISSPCKPS